MRGSTQGEMKLKTPAMNAPKRETFSIDPCRDPGSGIRDPGVASYSDAREISSVTRRSGITVGCDICSIWTLWPFTGGRSWNMVSHFQRSIGLLVLSQCSALTTWLSFGLLAVSSTPAVSNFGLAISIGLAFSFLLAPWAGDAHAKEKQP